LLPPDPRSGDILQLTLYWEPLESLKTNYKVFVHLVDSRGNIVGQRDSEPVGGTRPTTSWKPGELLSDNYGLLIPPGAPPGEHLLRVGIYDPASGQRLVVNSSGGAGGDAVDLARIAVAPAIAPPPIAALDMQYTDRLHWGALRLLGHSLYRLGAEHERELALRPGDTLKLLLFWQRGEQVPAQGSIVLALENNVGGQVLAQPLTITGGTFPVEQWREGDIVRDIQRLSLPSSLSPGNYRLCLLPAGGGELRPYCLGRVTIKP
jgi:hypothetical protein